MDDDLLDRWLTRTCEDVIVEVGTYRMPHDTVFVDPDGTRHHGHPMWVTYVNGNDNRRGLRNLPYLAASASWESARELHDRMCAIVQRSVDMSLVQMNVYPRMTNNTEYHEVHCGHCTWQGMGTPAEAEDAMREHRIWHLENELDQLRGPAHLAHAATPEKAAEKKEK